MSTIHSLKIKAKLLQKAKRRAGIIIPLKDAYSILAKLAGYPSWREMKEALEESEIFCPAKTSAFWKTWFSSYEEAKQHLLNTRGTFLLPYGKQFFVCDAHYLGWLGVSAEEENAIQVGRNWVEPKDRAAWRRLMSKIKACRAARAKIS